MCTSQNYAGDTYNLPGGGTTEYTWYQQDVNAVRAHVYLRAHFTFSPSRSLTESVVVVPCPVIRAGSDGVGVLYRPASQWHNVGFMALFFVVYFCLAWYVLATKNFVKR